MKRIAVLMLLGLFAVAVFATPRAMAQEKKEKPAVAAKEVRWHGKVVRVDKEISAVDVRRGDVERRIYYDSSTKWTKGTKTIEMSEVKEGSDVICMAKTDETGKFHATRIDLRR
jgi:Ni/Co efflux regulator RcnB